MPKYVKYGPQGYQKCTESMNDFLKNFPDIIADDESLWEVEIVEMSEKEYAQLPEFNGF